MKQLRRRTSLATMVSALAFTGCGVPPNHKAPPTSEQQVEVKPTVVRQNPVANEVISGASGQIRVLGGRTLLSELASGKFRAPLTKSMQTEHAAVSSTTPGAAAVSVAEDSLYIQLSKQLLGHGHLFGGVITTVSDQKNETLGRLKLTDLPAINVRPYVAAVEGSKDQFAVALVGCITKCTESSAQAVAIALPILGQTGDGKQLVVDIAKFGESLDLMSILDPDGEYSGLKTIGTRTTAVDMTDATIVWDVEHSMIPKDATSKAEAPVTIIGARYYLMLESALNSAFLSRKQIEGVGFFATSSRQEEVITRFSQTEFNQKPIHYFIKNVPTEYQASFAASFDGWNKAFKSEVGTELISYEFVSADDPKSALLVPGDIRFNIIEWDLVNKAPYGGLGPSVASQTTGQTFSANVLVQGPTIVEIYKEWFRVSAAAQELVAENKTAEADQLVLAARRSIITKLDAASSMPQHQLNLGSELKFRHNSQDMKLQDRIAARQDFFDTPAGETYESYMHGYFIDLVTHELGHNLGLRHNFKGNLLATADGAKPSGSVMEYLNREFRHRDSIGEYDLMAIRYGYTGAMPTRKDIFCTDENVVGAENPTFSAECSRDDATGDSFAYLGRILDRALDKIATPKEPTAPTWTVADVNKELTLAVTGRIAYGTSAEATSKTWLNWNSSGSRPRRPSAITQFVFKSLKDQLCAENLRSAPNRKKTEVAKQVTLKNLADLDAMVEAISVKFKLGTRLKCGGS